MAKPGPKKGEGGRPKKPIDWEVVKKLCHIQCTQSEITSIIGVVIDTLEDRCRAENEVTFSTFYKTHAETGKSSLRRTLWKMGTGERPNPGVAIWLSKQYLGMRDRFEDEKPPIRPVMITWENKTIQLSSEEAKALPANKE